MYTARCSRSARAGRHYLAGLLCGGALAAVLFSFGLPHARADDGGAGDGGAGDGGALISDGGSDAGRADAGAVDAAAGDLRDPLAGARLQGGGLSCALAHHRDPGGAAAAGVGLLGLLALLAWRRGRRGRRGLGAAAALGLGLLVPGSARADLAIDAMHFRPTGMPYGVLNVEGTAVLPSGQPSAGAMFAYGSAPLTLLNPAAPPGQPQAGVLSQTQMNMHLSIGAFGFLAVGVDIPVMLLQDLGPRDMQLLLHGGDPLRLPTQAGVGDVRLSVKVRLRDNQQKLGVAIMPLLTVPTGDAGSYLGWSTTSIEARVILDYRFGNGVLLAGNASIFTHEQTQALNLTLSHELRYGAGVAWPIAAHLEALLEIFGRMGLTDTDGSAAVTAENSPAEGLVGLRYAHSTGLVLSAGAGVGLGRGYGTPGGRAFLGLGYTPAVAAIPSGAGEAPATAAAGAPVQGPEATQGPGTETKQETPATPAPAAEQTATAAVAQGPAPAQPQVAAQPQVPAQPQVAAQAQVPAQTQVAAQPQVPAPAAAPPGQVRATLRGWLIETSEPLVFEPGQVTLTGRSEVILQAVAQLLGSRPDVRRVRIEVHVDDPRLEPGQPMTLSQRRAQAIKNKLGQQGVAAARLEAQGYGSSRLLDLSGTPTARSRNNRVELIIIE